MITVFFIRDVDGEAICHSELPCVPAIKAPVTIDGQLHFVTLVEWYIDTNDPRGVVYAQVTVGTGGR